MNQPTRIYWLIPIEWLLHFADESLFGFPEWATRHFAPLPRPLWVTGMLVGTVLLFMLAWRTSRPRGGATLPFVGHVLQTIFLCNACFHAIATVLFQEYSPGTATGLVVFLPCSLLFFRHAAHDARLTRPGRVVAAGVGFVVHALVVLSLFADKS